MRKVIHFLLNGEKREVSGDDLFLTLSDYLRYERQLTGTKVVCAEGDCGACTVMVAKKHPFTKPQYRAVNSCIAMMFSLDGASVVTVEGLAEGDRLSEVQESMIRNFGGQCGFCTPGFCMAITDLYESGEFEKPETQKVKNHLTGNLCRCTGYLPIIEAARDVDPTKHRRLISRYAVGEFSGHFSSPIFVQTESFEFFAPTAVGDACEYKKNNPDVTIFSGATDLGVQINKGHIGPRKILSLHLIQEFYKTELESDRVVVGSRVTFSELQKFIADKVPALNEYLHIFASPQIKNSATLAGNIANASPIGDAAPALLALDAELEIFGVRGSRLLELKEFFLGYKKTALAADEVIGSISFRIPGPDEKAAFYKVSQRRDLDISTVNAGFCFAVADGKITGARLAYGGVAATPVYLAEISESLIGADLTPAVIAQTKESLQNSLHPISDHRAGADYRRLLIGNLFERFAVEQLQVQL